MHVPETLTTGHESTHTYLPQRRMRICMHEELFDGFGGQGAPVLDACDNIFEDCGAASPRLHFFFQGVLDFFSSDLSWHVHVYVMCMCLCVSTHFVYIRARACACVYTSTNAREHLNLCSTYLCVFACVCMYVCMYLIHIHTYTHIFATGRTYLTRTYTESSNSLSRALIVNTFSAFVVA
jgi:hypothetical protein